MSDTPYSEPDAAASQASPGELLRRQRDALALSRGEVAEALNLRLAVIDGLEHDHYEEVPIATYRRGYLRSYASLLGLDPEQVLAAYQARHGGNDAETRVTPVHVVNKPPSRLGAWLFRLATVLVIAGLIGLTLMWWQSRGGSQPPTPGDNAPVAVDSLDGTTITEGGDATSDELDDSTGDWTREVATTSADEAAPAETEAGSVEDDAEGDTPAAPSEPADEATPDTDSDASSDAESVAVAEDGDDAAAETAGDPRVLELTFDESSWTEIFDANDQRVFVGLQEADTTARVEGEPPFRLTVGNATGVALTWQGESVDLASHTGANNVARFTLGE
ncbi:RodZ domain-containing protein [Halomonas borealis]|uniref:RodZ domain-containing protein n=1 Tax=Halomonas borealis TaxID=2508710 RepID=UPI00109F6AD3|nr:RodZ domain-containing protein [Halomonas borealis]